MPTIVFDHLEALAIDTRGPCIGFAPQVGECQDVFAVDLVVQLMKSIARLFLRFGVEGPLQLPNLFWSCQTHRQSPNSCALYLHLELRPLPSTGITRLLRYYEPVRHPTRPGSVPRGLPVVRRIKAKLRHLANVAASECTCGTSDA